MSLIHGTIIFFIYITTSIVLLTADLFNILGYDFSFVLAITAFYITGISLSLRQTPLKEHSFFKIICHDLTFYLLLASSPLVFMTLKGFVVTNCNYFKGFWYYILLPLVSVFFAFSLAVFIKSVLKRKTTRVISFILLSVLILLKLPYDLIFGVRIDSLNHIFGYLKGHIYDETLTVPAFLIIFRFYSLTIGCVLLLTAKFLTLRDTCRSPSFKKTEKIIFVLLIVLIIFINIFSSNLGVIRSEKFIQKELGHLTVSRHFNFYHPKTSSQLIREIVQEFEFRHYQLRNFLSINPSEKIDVYLYKDIDSQRKLIGTGGIFLAKPSTRQIHMYMNSPLKQPVKHELTHIMAGEFGLPIIRLSHRVALVEGLAVASSGLTNGLPLHDVTAALIKMGEKVNIKSYMTVTGFYKEQSAKAYIASASFTKFLIERFGIEKFKTLYGGKSYTKVYDQNISALEVSWKKYLESIEPDRETLNYAESIFKTASIFEKKCSREVATITKNNRSCDNGPKCIDNLTKALALSGGYFQTRNVLMQNLFKHGEYKNALIESEKIISENPTPYYTASALMIKAKCLILKNYTAEAIKNLRKVISLSNPSALYFDSIILIEFLKSEKLENLAKEFSKLSIDDFTFFKKALLNDIKPQLEAYLRLKLAFYHSNRQEYNAVIKEIAAIPTVEIPPPLKQLMLRIYGMSLLNLGNYAEAIDTFMHLRTIASNSSEKMLAQDLIDKVVFTKNNTISGYLTTKTTNIL